MNITNPAFNYDKFGQKYSGYRKTDPHIAKYIHAALGDAKTILNVGAGAGSYEPEDKYVVAVEPSVVMRAQRMQNNKVPAIIATAENLPFDDAAFDASMALVTVHHWPNLEAGLKEVRRVTRNQVLVMTADPDVLDNLWTAYYAPELIAVERARYPKIERITNALGGHCEVQHIPVTFDCADGFQEAFFGKPEAFLEKEVRRSQSAWGFLDEETENRIVQKLENDLLSGEWDRRFGEYRTKDRFHGSIRLIIARP